VIVLKDLDKKKYLFILFSIPFIILIILNLYALIFSYYVKSIALITIIILVICLGAVTIMNYKYFARPFNLYVGLILMISTPILVIIGWFAYESIFDLISFLLIMEIIGFDNVFPTILSKYKEKGK
jgi:hypothetical protein